MFKKYDKVNFKRLDATLGRGITPKDMADSLIYFAGAPFLAIWIPAFFNETAIIDQSRWGLAALLLKIYFFLMILFMVILKLSKLKYKKPILQCI